MHITIGDTVFCMFGWYCTREQKEGDTSSEVSEQMHSIKSHMTQSRDDNHLSRTTFEPIP